MSKQQLFHALNISCAIGVGFLFVCIIVQLMSAGLGEISWEYLSSTPLDAGRSGGISSIIISTLILLALCLVFSIPIALLTAIAITELFQHYPRLRGLIQRSLDLLASVPSIVFGLFGNIFFCQVLGLGFSLLSGALTLSCMILPILIRNMEVGFLQVPNSYRQAALTLGFSRWTTVTKILIPNAIPHALVGLILGLGRAAAETAALLFTSGFVARMPQSLFDSGRSLTVHIYELAMNVPGGNQRAAASALVLIGLLFFMNLVFMAILTRLKPKSATYIRAIT